MNNPINLSPLSRFLKGVSLSCQWLGGDETFPLKVDEMRTRLRTIRIAKNVFVYLSQLPHSAKEAYFHWVEIGDKLYGFSKILKNFNHYYAINHTASYKFIVHLGAISKIGTATYKILFVEMSNLEKAKQCILIIRKCNFLYHSLTSRSFPNFYLMLITTQFICEVMIDVQKHRK